MATQAFLPGSGSNPSLHIPKNLLYSFSIPHIQSHTPISSRLTLRFNRRFQCRNSYQASEGISPNFSNSKCRVRRKNIAVFVSGGGSNFRSIHDGSVQGYIHGDVVALVTNKHGCGGAEYARNMGIPVILFPISKDEPEGISADDLLTALRHLQVDIILLAGFLKLLPSELIRSYPRSILNIHPSLLPSFGGKGYYGMKVHKSVIASGARYTGATIHFVDEHYDTGCILAQRVVPVLATDTADDLAARVRHEEHRLYVEATSALCDERIVWKNNGVPLIQSKENNEEFN